ncbi:MAG TPA: VWA domain-containing protein [Gemmataceae bacterium]|nr:VWA domain-containing protein [Gemmataceae bacterium]
MDGKPQDIDDLTGGLRKAVEQVEASPVPADMLERVVDRATRLGPPKPLPRRRRAILAVASMAAITLLAIGLWVHFNRPKGASGPLEPVVRQSSYALEHSPIDSQSLSDGTSNTGILGNDWDGKPNGSMGPAMPGMSVIPGRPARPALVHSGKEGKGLPGIPDPDEPEATRLTPEKAAEVGGASAFNTEAYSHFVDNPFLAARLNPLSTFSIDVHTASYSNVRRFLLQERRLPPPDAVRIAELINYFPYTYPTPKDERPVAFTLNVAECPWNAKHQLVRIALAAKVIDPTKMPPRNLVFLVDTSGSMDAPNRLPLLKESLKLLVEQLTPRDRVALVAYAGSAGLVLPSTPGDEKATILNALSRLDAGGSTNGGEGIVLAYKEARRNFIEGGLNRVILGTDGDFNVGVTAEGDLVRLIDEERKGGVCLTVLGYGMGNLKDATMEKLAHHGHGHYAYIDSIKEARKVFVEQGAALVTVAKDVKLQIEFNPARVGAYRLVGYENRLMKAQDFNDDRKHAGDVGSGHTVTALYEVVPAGQPLPVPGVDALKYQQPSKPAGDAKGEWLTVKLRYKDPTADTSKLLSQALAGPVGKFDRQPEDFRFAAAVASFGMLLRNSEHRAGSSFAGVRELAKDALGDDPHGHRAEFLKLVDAAAELAPKKAP